MFTYYNYFLSQVNKAPPVSKIQSIKFANYFMSRKSVHQVNNTHLMKSISTLRLSTFSLVSSVNKIVTCLIGV